MSEAVFTPGSSRPSDGSCVVYSIRVVCDVDLRQCDVHVVMRDVDLRHV